MKKVIRGIEGKFGSAEEAIAENTSTIMLRSALVIISISAVIAVTDLSIEVFESVLGVGLGFALGGIVCATPCCKRRAQTHEPDIEQPPPSPQATLKISPQAIEFNRTPNSEDMLLNTKLRPTIP